LAAAAVLAAVPGAPRRDPVVRLAGHRRGGVRPARIRVAERRDRPAHPVRSGRLAQWADGPGELLRATVQTGEARTLARCGRGAATDRGPAGIHDRATGAGVGVPPGRRDERDRRLPEPE